MGSQQEHQLTVTFVTEIDEDYPTAELIDYHHFKLIDKLVDLIYAWNKYEKQTGDVTKRLIIETKYKNKKPKPSFVPTSSPKLTRAEFKELMSPINVKGKKKGDE